VNVTASGLTCEIACPCCGSADYAPWAHELGFTAVRCRSCRLIYVNPRPTLTAIESAVRSGVHGADAGYLDVRTKRIDARVSVYQKRFAQIFADVWARGAPIAWLDVGAGNGEIVEAIIKLAPAGSRIEGVEPMDAKACIARARGLNVQTSYLSPDQPKVDFVSVIDVFSHIPQFDSFLADVKSVLLPGGELFIETGNLADLDRREEFPGELGLPDHLVFAGESQLDVYLKDAGFETVSVGRVRVDGAVYFAKNVVKKLLGRPVTVRLPYSSKYRQLLIRARAVA
jgi:SAM-dependent methyltransferase